MTFYEKVQANISKYDLMKNVHTIFVGLSGGADSTALLLILQKLSSELCFTVKAIHINHNLRGEESVRDEKFCLNLCEKLGIEVFVHSVNVMEYSAKNKLSVELSARELRYEIFEKYAKNGKIATAHNLSDFAETVLINLVRGTGMKGLLGIPISRGEIIRPMIDVSKAEILQFLTENEKDFVEDSSNASDDYTRNKIRHKIAPTLSEINQNYAENIYKMSENLKAENDFLEEISLAKKDEDLREVHTALRKRIIRNFLSENNFEVSYNRICEIEDMILSEKNSGKINISGDKYILVSNGKLEAISLKDEQIIFPETVAKIGENLFLDDEIVIISKKEEENITEKGNVHKTITKNVADCDKIQGNIVLRNRRNGDKYMLLGRSFTSSLKKLFNENVPQNKRDFIPILCDDLGIIWTEPFGISERVKVTANTKNIIKIKTVKRGKENESFN